MADVFTLRAPLLVRYQNGKQCLIAEKFLHPEGLVYVKPFWLDSELPEVHLLKGEIKGEGPWKIGDVIIRLLSCADTEQAMEWAQWQQFLLSCPEQHAYHDNQQKRAIISQASFSD